MMIKRKIFTLCVALGLLMVSPYASAEDDVKNEEGQEFSYHQRMLKNPTEKIKVKTKKIRVAISDFSQDVEIAESPFNVTEEENIEGNTGNTMNIYGGDEAEIEKDKKKGMPIGLLTDALIKSGKYEVIERKEINELLREIDFQNSKFVQEEANGTLGNIYGVQYIISGEVIEESGKYTVAVRMYNVNSGEVLSSGAKTSAVLKDAVKSAVKELSQRVFPKGWSCKIVGVNPESVYINAGFNDDLEKEDTFRVVRVTGQIIDPETKEVLGLEKKKIAVIEITDVLDDDLSSAELKNKFSAIKMGDIVESDRVEIDEKTEKQVWDQIYNAQSKTLKKEEVEEYAFKKDELRPEAIMSRVGTSVVKIQTDKAVGSGFIVGKNNTVVTNYHIIRNASYINIKLIEKKQYFERVKVIKTNPDLDLAVLRIEGADTITPVPLGDSNKIKVGERVIAVGNPEGLENTVSDGLVSGVRDFRGAKVIQTSVPVTHGSSGGPLLNMKGEAIGVIAAGLDKKGNINFAVPSNYIVEEML